MINKAEKSLKEERECLAKDFEKAESSNKKLEPVKFKPLENPSIYLYNVEELNRANDLLAVKVGDTGRAVDVRLEEWRKEYPTLNKLGSFNAYVEFTEEDENGGPVTQRRYFRDYYIHDKLKEMGYIPLRHGTSTKTYESLTGRKLTIPEEVITETISQEFFTYGGEDKTSPRLVIEASQDLKRVITPEVIRGILEEIEKNPKNFREYFGTSNIDKAPKDYRCEKPADYAPYGYQEAAVKSLVEKFLKDPGPANQKLLDSGTGSGKSNMFIWSSKAIFAQFWKGSPLSEEEWGLVFSPARLPQKDRTLTVATSAIPDVLEELRKAIDSHGDFRNDWVYLTANQVKNSAGQAIEDAYNGELLDFSGNKIPPVRNVMIGASLQNMGGRKKNSDGKYELKEIHKILDNHIIDLVLGDEAHFAMFSGAVYKEALETAAIEDSAARENIKEIVDEESEELIMKRPSFSLNPLLGTLLASATTIKLLFENIFNIDDDVVYVSQAEIDNQAAAVNAEYERRAVNPIPGEKKVEVFDSPFYGKPQQNYFGLNLGEEAKDMFGPKEDSTGFHNPQAERFFDALLTGRKNGMSAVVPNILSDETLQKVGAGRHILINVSSKSSADVTEAYLDSIKEEIEEACGRRVHILNVSSAKESNEFTSKNVSQIKDYITKHRFDTTITITVNRFTTGVSIPYWDTIVIARGPGSIPKRIQTYGRANRTWVEEIESLNPDTGALEVEKVCLKPNTFIIDCAGDMVYEMVLDDEITHKTMKKDSSPANSPYVKVIDVEEGHLRELSPEDLRGKLKEAREKYPVDTIVKSIPLYGFDLDYALFDGSGAKGKMRGRALSDPVEGGVDMEIDLSGGDKPKGSAGDKSPRTPGAKEKKINKREIQEEINRKILVSGIILDLTSISDLDDFLASPSSEEFRANMGWDVHFIEALRQILDESVLVSHRLNQGLAALSGRVYREGALQVFTDLSRLSSNEVMAPPEVIRMVLDNLDLPKIIEGAKDRPRFIDLGSKAGEFMVELKRRVDAETREGREVRAEYWAVPTSGIAYEIIRKVYETEGLPLDQILWSHDLPDFHRNWAFAVITAIDLERGAIRDARAKNIFDKMSTDKEVVEGLLGFVREWLERMREEVIELADGIEACSEAPLFDAVVGNPPYQDSNPSKSGKDVPNDIFQYFQDAAKTIAKETVLIYPARRWMQEAGKNTRSWGHNFIRDSKIASILYFENSSDVFDKSGVQDGISIVNWKKDHDNGGFQKINSELVEIPKEGIIALSPLAKIAQKSISNSGGSTLSRSIFARGTYGIESNHLKENPGSMILLDKGPTKDKTVKIITIGTGSKPEWHWISMNDLNNQETVKNWKVVVSSSHPVRDFSDKMILGPNEVHGRSKVSLNQFSTEQEAQNFFDYLATDTLTSAKALGRGKRRCFSSDEDSGTSFLNNYLALRI